MKLFLFLDLFTINIFLADLLYIYEDIRAVNRGAGAQVCDCKREVIFWVQFLLEEIKYLIF